MAYNLTDMKNYAKWSGLTTIKDLGFANSWKETPSEVLRCEELGHEKSGKTTGNCLHEIGCKICGYFYRVDSSG